jgi:hypothetical protein
MMLKIARDRHNFLQFYAIFTANIVNSSIFLSVKQVQQKIDSYSFEGLRLMIPDETRYLISSL